MAGLAMPEQLRVAHAEERPAQHADHRRPVVRIGERREQVGQAGDAGGLGEGGAAAHLHGQALGLERAGVEGQRPPDPRQDEEVAGRAAARVDLAADEAGDGLGVDPGRPRPRL